MKKQLGSLFALTLFLIGVASGSPQATSEEIKTATLLKRAAQDGVDNYPQYDHANEASALLLTVFEAWVLGV